MALNANLHALILKLYCSPVLDQLLHPQGAKRVKKTLQWTKMTFLSDNFCSVYLFFLKLGQNVQAIANKIKRIPLTQGKI